MRTRFLSIFSSVTRCFLFFFYIKNARDSFIGEHQLIFGPLLGLEIEAGSLLQAQRTIQKILSLTFHFDYEILKLNFEKRQFSKLSVSNKKRPRRDSNPQSSDPKSDALSIRPRGRLVIGHYF